MRLICLCRGTAYLLLAFSMVAPVLAGEATEQIRETTDKVIAVLSNPALKGPSRAEEKKNLVARIAVERFDWEEMARRALAIHWVQRTDEEKKEFVPLFRELLESTYMDRIDDYSGEKVIYEKETTDGDYGVVRVRVVTSADDDIPVEYRVKKKENGWFIYDISVEGVSLINNYRTQFNSIILKSSYQKLVKRLKAKIDQK